MSVLAVDAAPVAVRDGLVRRLVRNPMGVVSLAVLGLVALTAVLAPLLAPDPNAAALSDIFAPVSSEHWLGGDSAGRDLFARLVVGSRFSLLGAGLALGTAMLVGVPSGLVAGYYGGWFDSLSSWSADLVQALPGIVVLLAARAVVGPSMWWSMLIFGVILSPAFFRLVRASVSAVRDELYVDAARVSGVTDARIVSRHVLTVVRAPIVIQAAIIMGIAIAIQAGLEFLGLGDASIPTWGSMLNEAFDKLYVAPQLLLWPGLLLGLTCAALVLLANALRDALEDRSGGGRRVRPRPTAPAAAAPAEGSNATGTTGALLEVTDLAVGYPQAGGAVKHVVDGLSLHVDRGEVLGLVGESGSGKTQTAFAILGLLPADGEVTAGRIRFQGRDLAACSPKELERLRGRRIAYVPQEPMSNLDPSFTIGSQLVEPMRVCLGLSAGAARNRALELLEQVGIPEPRRTFGAYPHQVSGGMAQRVLIAGAVSCDPELLIADEPTTALDVTVQADVLDLLRDLQSERDLGVILVTHNFGVVADLCDRVAVMQSGRIVEQGTVRETFTSPQHPYTRMLLDATLEDADTRAVPSQGGAE